MQQVFPQKLEPQINNLAYDRLKVIADQQNVRCDCLVAKFEAKKMCDCTDRIYEIHVFIWNKSAYFRPKSYFVGIYQTRANYLFKNVYITSDGL